MRASVCRPEDVCMGRREIVGVGKRRDGMGRWKKGKSWYEV